MQSKFTFNNRKIHTTNLHFRPDKCQLQFTAHSGPIYTCDWHPTQPWIATGSRDKQIKVWKMEQKPSLEYTIHTIAVVGRVKWRPERMHHIASCALVVDYSIYIWDVRRPYIPYASFNDHTNVTTGIGFKGNDPDTLISASKDSTIVKHAFKDAFRPVTKANPQGTSLSHNGDLMFTYKIKNVAQPVTTAAATSTRTSFINSSRSTTAVPPVINNDQFHLAKSCLISYNAKPKQEEKLQNSPKEVMKTGLYRDFIAFQCCAKEYILTGASLADICDYNADIAKKYGKSNVSMLWKFIKNQYAFGKTSQNAEARNSTSSQNILPNRILIAQQHQQQQNSSTITPGWGSEDKMNDTLSEDALAKMCCEDLNLQDFRHPKSGEFKHPGGPSQQIQNGVTPATVDSDSLDNIVIYGEKELTVADMHCVKGFRNGFLYCGPHDLTKEWSLPNNNLNELNTTNTEQLTASSQSDNNIQVFLFFNFLHVFLSSLK